MQAWPPFHPALRQLQQGAQRSLALRFLSSLQTVPARTPSLDPGNHEESVDLVDLQGSTLPNEESGHEDDTSSGRFHLQYKDLVPRQELEAGQSSPGAVAVPAELSEAISKAVAGYSPRSLRHLTRQLSEGLHDHSRGWLSSPLKEIKASSSLLPEGLLADWKTRRSHKDDSWNDDERPDRRAPRYTDGQVAAYAASRMPATYAALVHVLEEVKWQRPGFVPERVLDFGSGLGSALWAARSVWGTWPKQAVAVEKARGMAELADTILRGAENAPPVHRFRSLDALLKGKTGAHQHFDMVIAAYALGEQGSAEERKRVLRKLWGRTKSLLVVVEAGTPRGFEIVLEAREALLIREDKRAARQGDGSSGGGAHVVAPCPHDGACPMSGGTQWCHVAQRLQRTGLQRVAKRADVALRAHEDEKFSYVVIQRGPRANMAHGEERRATSRGLADAGSFVSPPAVDEDDEHFGGEAEGPSLELNGDDYREDIPSRERTESDAVTTAVQQETQRSFRSERMGVLEAEAADPEGCVSGDGKVLSLKENDAVGNEKAETLQANGSENGANDGELANHSPRQWARLISPPRQRHGHVILDLCCPGEERTGQLERRTVSKGLGGEPGSKERYSQARKARWGSRWHWDIG